LVIVVVVIFVDIVLASAVSTNVFIDTDDLGTTYKLG